MALTYFPKSMTNDEMESALDYGILEQAQAIVRKYRPDTTGYPAVTIIEMDFIKSEISNKLFDAYLDEKYPNIPERKVR